MNTKNIAEFLDGKLIGDGEIEISGVASLENASAEKISFVEQTGNLTSTDAGCLLVPEDSKPNVSCAFIEVNNPKLAFAKIAKIFHPPKQNNPIIHHSAVIAETAVLGKDLFIGAFVCVGENSVIGDGTKLRAGAKIGDNVSVGKNCVFHPNVFVEDNCTIKDNVILHCGVVIGADGFGFVRDKDQYIKFPQIGTVIIEEDVEIGANSCIDRGSLGETRIGKGSKIDNLVQIAHNVQIGKRVIIAAQTGISGSTIIEDDCVIGGQVGMGDHATIKSGAIIGSQAGVLPGKIVRAGVWWGTPVQPLDEYKRQNAYVKGLKRLREDIKKLMGEIAALKEKN